MHVCMYVCMSVCIQFPADFTILAGNCKYYQTTGTLIGGSGAVAASGMVETDPFMRVSVEAKPALQLLTLVTEAVQCEVVSTHIQANTNRSRHVVIKNETQPLSLLLFCSWDRI